jgi:aerobic carbon-monoxide dehydrogenase medium subunit
MIPARVAYARPSTVQEAIELLGNPEAKLLAGGHSLIPMMKLRLSRPSLLVDIGRLGMRGLTAENGHIEVGALTTYDVLASGSADQVPDALREAAAAVGDVQVRNRGTIGGGTAHADPASDCAASLIALGVRLRLRSADGTRECAAEDFFISPFTTALRPSEIIESLAFPRPGPGQGSAYYATSDAASGYPLAGVAVHVEHDGDRPVTVRVGLTGAAPAPCRLSSAEHALTGSPSFDAVRDAVADVRLGRGGVNTRYRRQLVAVAVIRAFHAAVARAGGGPPS